MPYKDKNKRKDYAREYYREYMSNHPEYRITSEKNRTEYIQYCKDNNIIAYKLRRISKKYGINGVNAFLRDNCSCIKCGEVDLRLLELDHIIPKSKKGFSKIENLQTLCSNCHTLKTFEEDSQNSKDLSINWDKHWFDFTNFLAKKSNCLSRKVGACLVDENNIVKSVGFNNTPMSVSDCSNRHRKGDSYLCSLLEEKEPSYLYRPLDKCPRQILGYKSGEGLDICIAGHAERNALINAARQGIRTKGVKMYMNCPVPCKDCLIEIINAGIEEIIFTEMKFYDRESEYLINYVCHRTYNF